MAVRATPGQELFGTLYRKGAVVFREGDSGEALYVIQSGAVEVSRETAGCKRVLALLERGDFFGEMAIVDDEQRSATVTAIAETRPWFDRAFTALSLLGLGLFTALFANWYWVG